MRSSAFLVAALLAAACDPTGPRDVRVPPPGAVLSLTDSELRLGPGDQYFVDAHLRDSLWRDLPAIPLSFRSTNAAVASVDTRGRVVARQIGAARVVVRAGTLADTLIVLVHPPEPRFEGSYVGRSKAPCTAPSKLEYRFLTPDSVTSLSYYVSSRYGELPGELVSGRYALAPGVTVAHFGTFADTLRFSSGFDSLYVAAPRFPCADGGIARYALLHVVPPRAATLGLPPSIDAVVGDRIDPRMTARDPSGTVIFTSRLFGSGVTYVVDDTSVVAPTDDNGSLIGRRAGSATLRVTWGGARAYVRVNIGVPAAVAWDAVDAGSCGVSTAGRVLCWGAAPVGRTATDDNHSRIPRAITAAGQFRVVDVSWAQPFACALPAGSPTSPVCWGWLPWIAAGEADSPSAPTVATGIARADTLAIGGQAACALDRSADEVWCWNHPYVAGLASGPYTAPRLVARGLRATRITAGDTHACLLDDSGRVYCWGSNFWGQAGLPSAPDVCADTRRCALEPTPVPTDLRFTRLSAGYNSTCGVTTDARIACWGAGISGLVSYQTASEAYGTCDGAPCLPVTLAPIPGTFAEVAVGTSHGCGLTTAGEAVCWGFGHAAGHTTSAEDGGVTRVGDELRFVSISVSMRTTCATAAGGRAYCWGAEPGAGTSDVVAVPVEVAAAAP